MAPLDFPEDHETIQALIAYLEKFIIPNKQEKIDQLQAHRTRYLMVVLKSIYQSWTVSAALILSGVVNRLHNCEIMWRLSPEKTLRLKLRWYQKGVNRGEKLARCFLEG